MNKIVRLNHLNNLTINYGLFGFIIFCSGLILSGPTLYYRLKQGSSPITPVTLPSLAPISSPEVKTGQPAHIAITNINVDLAVAEGVYNQQKGEWNVSTDKAHFATISSAPNDQYGNTFIYGHNRKNVFSRLSELKPGAEAVITTTNNLKFVYTLSAIEETDPSNAAVILPYSQQPTLTLQTCSGSWYQNRQIFRFTLSRVEPA